MKELWRTEGQMVANTGSITINKKIPDRFVDDSADSRYFPST